MGTKKVHNFTITGMGIVIYGKEIKASYRDCTDYLSILNKQDGLSSGNGWRFPHLDECKFIYNLSTEALLMGTRKGNHLYWLSGESPRSGEALVWSEDSGVVSRNKVSLLHTLRPIRNI